MTSLSTKISRIRSLPADNGRETPFPGTVGNLAARAHGTDTPGAVAPEHRAELLEAAQDVPFVAQTPNSPQLMLVINRLMAFCEILDHRVIGISSDSGGSGVSLLTRELARGYAKLRRPVCLIDASRFDRATSPPNVTSAPTLDLRTISRQHPDGYLRIDLNDLPISAAFSTADFHESLSPFRNDTDIVLVDLPPVCEPDGTACTTTMTVGAACDIVVLVCLTGVVTSNEFCRSLISCKAGRVKVGGIVLNDWKLPGSHLIPGA